MTQEPGTMARPKAASASRYSALTGADPSARVDSTGLRYTVRHGQLYVSYPHRNAGHGGHGTGFAIGPIPPAYRTSAPNEITRERVALWMDLIAGVRSVSPVGQGRHAACNGCTGVGDDCTNDSTAFDR
jgi:hypothetical protein